MPQPITNVRPGASIFIAPGEVVTQRPALALEMLDTITQWPHAENAIGSTLATILHVDGREVIEQFIQRANSVGQREILLRYATDLPHQELETLHALLMMFEQDFKERNKLVHWLSGISPQIEEGILLVNPSANWRFQIASYESTAAHLTATTEEEHQNIKRAEFPREKVFVYTKGDFDRIRRDFAELIKGFWSLQWILSPYTAEHAREYDRLRALPRFLPTLERLRADQKNPQEGHPK